MRYLTFIGVLVAILFWYAVVYLNIFHSLFLVPPHKVFFALVELFQEGGILKDILITLYRTIIGFLLASLVGISFGLLLGYSKVIYKIFQPLVDFLRSIPALALFPLFLLLFGIGDEAKIAVVVFGAGLLITINSMYGVQNANKARILYAKTLNLTNFQIFRKVVFFEALPYIFVGLRQAISISLVFIVVMEMFIGTNIGLGQRIFNSHLTYRIDDMYASILITGILGYLLNIGFIRMEKRILHWV